jgi:hypothetical protein
VRSALPRMVDKREQNGDTYQEGRVIQYPGMAKSFGRPLIMQKPIAVVPFGWPHLDRGPRTPRPARSQKIQGRESRPCKQLYREERSRRLSSASNWHGTIERVSPPHQCSRITRMCVRAGERNCRPFPLSMRQVDGIPVRDAPMYDRS